MSNNARFGIVGKLYAITAVFIAILVGTAALVTARLDEVIRLGASAAAAANLDRQAHELVECVATFKTERSEACAATAFQPAAPSKQSRHYRKLRLSSAIA